MAINKLRQQQLFDQFDITSGGIMGPYSYGEEDQGQRQVNQEETAPTRRLPVPPQMPTPNQGMPSVLGTPAQMGSIPRVGTLAAQSQQTGQQESIDTRTQRIFDAINKVYTPQTRATDRFNNLLDAFPERQEPDLGARIAGATAFLGNKTRNIPGGYEIQDKVMNAPYYRDVAAWKEKTGPFQQGAQIENTGNTQERQLASNVVTGVWNIDRSEQQATEARRRTEEQAETARQRELTTRQRDYLKYLVDTGNVEALIKDGPTVVAILNGGRKIDTGIPSDSVSALELEAYKQAGAQALKRIPEGGGGPGGGPQVNSLEYERQRQQRMRDMTETTQDWETYLQQVGNGYQMKPRPVVAPAGWGWFGANEVTQDQVDAWDRIKAFVDPGYKPPVYQQQQVPPPPPNNQQQQAPGQVQQQAPPNQGQPTGLAPTSPPINRVSPYGNYNTMNPSANVRPVPTPPAPPPLPSGAAAAAQQEKQEVANGTRVYVVDRKTGRPIGTIPNTPEARSFYDNNPQFMVK